MIRPQLCDSCKCNSPEEILCGSANTTSSTYIREKNGFVNPAPYFYETRYPRGKEIRDYPSAGELTCTSLVAACMNEVTIALQNEVWTCELFRSAENKIPGPYRQTNFGAYRLQ